MSTNTVLIPFTLALLATAACGGSTSKGNPDNDQGMDSGTEEDTGSTLHDSGGGNGDTGVAGDSGSVADSGPVAVDGGKFVAVPLDMCGEALQYAATATIGTQQFQLALDTGSGSIGVAGATCTTCGVAPTYTPGPTATDEMQTVDAQYGSGSWIGEIYQDNVALGPSMAVPVKFGSMTSQNAFLEPNETQCQAHSGGVQGILGYGPTASAFPGTTEWQPIYVGTENVPDLFAFNLCDTGGTLWLGGFDGTQVTAPPQFTPMMDVSGFGQYYYLIDFESISINGMSISVSNGNPSLVDTGTSIFIIGTAAYTSLVSQIEGNAAFAQIFGANFFPAVNNQYVGPCMMVTETKQQLDAMLPPITLTFGTGSSAINVQAAATDSYLYFAGGQTWCNGLAGSDMGAQGPSATVGAPALKASVVIFDRANQQFGFAPRVPCQ